MKRKSYERNRRLIGQTHKPIGGRAMSIDITKEKFDAFKKIQKSGKYNMFDPRAREMTSLSQDEWVTIMRDYEKLNNAWSKKDEN